MKKKVITVLTALLTAAAMSACGEVEGDSEKRPDDVSSQQETVSQTDSSLPDDGSSMLSDVPPDEDSSSEDSSSENVIELKINTYSGDEIPQELIATIMMTLNGAAGDYADFEKVFDTDILIEAQLRSSVSDPDELANLRSQYDENTRRMTTRQNYDMLHSSVSGKSFTKLPEPIKLQAVNKDIDSGMIFDLNFDIESSSGPLTFFGIAYRVDGKWGAIFEPGKHMTDEELEQQIGEKKP